MHLVISGACLNYSANICMWYLATTSFISRVIPSVMRREQTTLAMVVVVLVVADGAYCWRNSCLYVSRFRRVRSECDQLKSTPRRPDQTICVYYNVNTSFTKSVAPYGWVDGRCHQQAAPAVQDDGRTRRIYRRDRIRQEKNGKIKVKVDENVDFHICLRSDAPNRNFNRWQSGGLDFYFSNSSIWLWIYRIPHYPFYRIAFRMKRPITRVETTQC